MLATNTSSLSVTAIAAACRRPQRVAGLHFFNPVPLMKLVEIVDGLRTDAAVVERLVALTRLTGHVPVVARDTPGFIVNHAGRGFGTEALKALGEGAADVPTIDRILREQVSFDGQGFKLGPFELLDLTALDVSQPVMESIYRQFYDEPRFRPSVIAAQRLAAGLFGRKTGEGFYVYEGGRQQAPSESPRRASRCVAVWVAPGPRAGRSARRSPPSRASSSRPSDRASTRWSGGAAGARRDRGRGGLPAQRTVAVDTLFPIAPGTCRRRVLMPTPATSADYCEPHALSRPTACWCRCCYRQPGFVAQRCWR